MTPINTSTTKELSKLLKRIDKISEKQNRYYKEHGDFVNTTIPRRRRIMMILDSLANEYRKLEEKINSLKNGNK